MLRNHYVLSLLIFTASIFGCNNSTSNAENKKVEIVPVANNNTKDQAAPEFTLYTLDGKEVKLSDYFGKVVILDFWATWCPPCRKGIPDLVSIQNEFKDDLVVIGISLDQPSTIKNLKQFIEDYGINYPVVLGTQEVSSAYGNIQAIPTSFIIDQKGNINNKHIGLVLKSVLIKEISTLFKKHN
jgi:cytochrome c biogenesis protein CcmG/thiol:disulfide interchange protein DsbE